MTTTAEAIEAATESFEDEYGEFDWQELHSYFDSFEMPGIGTLAHVQSFGGEGEGDSAWLVISVTDEDGHKQFFRKDGYHASFDGTYLDGDLYEVTPAEKTITVYNKV